ncbi:MarR family winged helix-turn-helix transcriptional regulator [Amycolatopsis cihanbeyliensis]|uniref:DNA-binding MarR family transcriptional regulator n=1 Tax=Amycolatopsis cihanbeyliensis TaxID=1128664 RepID=A0A542DIL9_AMYCI|nr:MarR family transcriptional regulator [Amycolatopsis cihanbeyliensis]TQJ02910.1 DNA-binding MarR family transcriptional regulator [Amycolatopsis cihanbeyliensis]
MNTEEGACHPVPPAVLARFAELGRAESAVTVLLHARLAERIGLSATDHKALELLGHWRRPLTAGRLAELTGLSTGAVTGVIDRLERAGFARRVRDPADRRKVLVEVPAEGEERAAPAAGLPLRLTERVLAEFSPGELEVVERFLVRRLELIETEAFGGMEIPHLRR